VNGPDNNAWRTLQLIATPFGLQTALWMQNGPWSFVAW
jgi:hypothetical protein